MKKLNVSLSEANMLRQKAEELLKRKKAGNKDLLTEVDTLKLLYELESIGYSDRWRHARISGTSCASFAQGTGLHAMGNCSYC